MLKCTEEVMKRLADSVKHLEHAFSKQTQGTISNVCNFLKQTTPAHLTQHWAKHVEV